jgi:hypothetical protein
MNSNDQPPPVADDDFPEFSAPPQHTPRPARAAQEPRTSEKAADKLAANGQSEVDDVIARLRRERAEGKR